MLWCKGLMPFGAAVTPMIVRAPNRSQGRLGCLKPGLGQSSLLTSLIYWLFALVSGEVYMYTPYIIILLDQKQE